MRNCVVAMLQAAALMGEEEKEKAKDDGGVESSNLLQECCRPCLLHAPVAQDARRQWQCCETVESGDSKRITFQLVILTNIN
jgi:hypothetical protein